ncbi:MAG: DUF177 domain-containing protein [Bacteroidetes bacterium]|nr:DUF177 domain-containing protein [Bacteroidota bacterium]MCW5896621.1 DUF177 domain-containing protein [Bacteroidota bacterium]
MKIQITGLSDGIHRYQFAVNPAELTLGEYFDGDVAVEAVLDKSAAQILLTASITATARFTCDRCISLFTQRLNSEYSMLYVNEGIETQHLDPAEVQVIPPGLHIINIAEDVRQTVMLSVPLKVLCKETCKGLCPLCGTNLNEQACTCSDTEIDSRWEELRKLQSN